MRPEVTTVTVSSRTVVRVLVTHFPLHRPVPDQIRPFQTSRSPPSDILLQPRRPAALVTLESLVFIRRGDHLLLGAYKLLCPSIGFVIEVAGRVIKTLVSKPQGTVSRSRPNLTNESEIQPLVPYLGVVPDNITVSRLDLRWTNGKTQGQSSSI
ncbi:hypothetical protein EVAR_89907_1 [Eumeta japonica]|uniref:Uncharacterized protein n=1 Tax=Eumeta variegata TaxID=151549 RepID=A0A4C2ADQ3_EUMVA|nr:hypothetical protein EVAR_89907_1 [Eumeta japonica]